MTFPRVGIYASMRSTGANLIRPDGVLDTDHIQRLAQWQDVILELACMNANPRIGAALRAARPDIRLHAYVVMSAWQSQTPFFRDLYDIVQRTDGWAWLTSGRPWSFANISCANHDTMDQMADLILANVTGAGVQSGRVMNAVRSGTTIGAPGENLPSPPLWSGVFLDVLVPRLMHSRYRPGSDELFDWQRMGFATEDHFLLAWENGARRLVQRLKVQGPVVTNYGRGFHEANGHVVEAFPGTNHETWEQTMKAAIEAPHAEPTANWFCSEPVGTWTNGVLRYDPEHPENRRRQDYHDASACLAGAFGTFGRYEGDAVWCRDRYAFYSPNYKHPQLGEGWLGEPLRPAIHVTDSGGPRPKPVDLWTRDFQRGIVIVNPSASAHSLYLHMLYKPIGGAAKRAFALKPKTGLLLERVGT